MKSLPSRFRRLDGALADLPMEDPMLLTELDGFLTGILLSPEPIAPFEWMQGIWGSDDDAVPPFEDPLDVRWFADAVMARYAEIARDLGRGKPQPIYDIDERSGEVLWEYWVDGLAQAMDLRPDGWAALAKDDDPDAVEAMADLSLLIAVARDDSTLDSMEINALQPRVPAMLTRCLSQLHVLHVARGAALPVSAPGVEAVKVGRNDPCPCGSGRKSKRCCG